MKKAKVFDITLGNPYEDRIVIAHSMIEAMEGIDLKQEQFIRMVILKDGDVSILTDKP